MTENPRLVMRVSQECLVIEAVNRNLGESCYISYSFRHGSLSANGQKPSEYIPESDLTEEEILDVFKAVRDFIIEKRKREYA